VYLNRYKTAKTFGAQESKISKKTGKILDNWFALNDSGWLLTQIRDREQSLGANGLTKLLNTFFRSATGKNISTSMLRHIIISHERRNDPTIQEQIAKERKTENRFLHNVAQNDNYRKVD